MTGCSFDWLFLGDGEEAVNNSNQVGDASKSAPEDEEEIKVGPNKVRPLSRRELELRVTRLTSRIEGLEMQLNRQKENFTILRRGMTTGLIPNEWSEDEPYYNGEGEGENRDDAQVRFPSYEQGNSDRRIRNPVDILLNNESGSKGSAGLTNKQRKEYERKVAKGSEHFEAGEYGKAINIFAEIGGDYSPKLTKGNYLLWIGASWFRMKEYQSARKNLHKLVKNFKSSPYQVEARFLLAKSDAKEGYTERAISRYKKIIAEFPKSNIADRSREELKRIEESL
tara:strand:+ start:158 stop:1003 length:846 start_codon:yes stop_codon:yes gene_type:complete